LQHVSLAETLIDGVSVVVREIVMDECYGLSLLYSAMMICFLFFSEEEEERGFLIQRCSYSLHWRGK
jgi:hypothetical protein